MENKKILVTGGKGFLGSRLVVRLSKENAQVIVVDKAVFKTSLKNVTFYKLDISEMPPLPFLENIDYVFHLAAAKDSAGEKACYATNVKGTENILYWLGKLSPNLKKFVYIGSLLSEGFRNKGAASLYGKTKLLAEGVIENNPFGIPYLILRTARIYGPGDKRGFFSILKFMQKGIMPLVSNMEERFASLIYIDDAIDAMIISAESDIKNRIYYLSDGNMYAWQAIYEIMASSLGKDYNKLFKIVMPAKVIEVFSPFIRKIGKLINPSLEGHSLNELGSKQWVCDPSSFLRDTGFRPKHSLREGMKKTVEWFLNFIERNKK